MAEDKKTLGKVYRFFYLLSVSGIRNNGNNGKWSDLFGLFFSDKDGEKWIKGGYLLNDLIVNPFVVDG